MLKVHPGLLDLSHASEDSDEEEHFVDLATDDVGDEHAVDAAEKEIETKAISKQSSKSSWVHRSNISGEFITINI